MSPPNKMKIVEIEEGSKEGKKSYHTPPEGIGVAGKVGPALGTHDVLFRQVNEVAAKY